MWSYFGAKLRIIDCYPKPIFNTVIEPCAGSAPYAVKYFENDVYLYDKYPVIIGIWNYLKQCSVNDIMSLKCPPKGTVIGYEGFDCDAQRHLIGFMIARVQRTPANTVTSFGLERFDADKKRIAANLFKIRHFKCEVKSYEEIPNEPATWFFDWPYQFGGETYKFNNRKIDFNHAAQHAQSRLGQVIVCENNLATWLPFVPMKTNQGVAKVSNEVIWTNYHTHFNNQQTQLFTPERHLVTQTTLL